MEPKNLSLIVPEFSSIADAPIYSQIGELVGWHATVLDRSSAALGSGVGPDQDTSRRIAIAETIERALFKKLMMSKSPGFDFEKHPNTDGFACGFENQPAMFRAICEAVERWAWSQWIDLQKNLPVVESPEVLSDLTTALLEMFDTSTFFHRKIPIVLGETVLELHFGVLIAELENGVFAGSKVGLSQDKIWEHSAVEAFRNLNIFRNGIERNDIICARVKYFGQNRHIAWNQIQSATALDWPFPKIKLLKQMENSPKGIFLWRALCDGYLDWYEGSVERFVY